MEKKNNYLVGGIGSLLFAILGSLPFVLLYVYCDVTWAFLAFFIGIAAFIGYRLFQGRLDKKAFIIIAVLTVLVTLDAILITIPSLLIIRKDMGSLYEILPLLYKNSDFTKVIIRDTIIALLFSLFSIYYLYKKIFMTNRKEEVKEEKKVEVEVKEEEPKEVKKTKIVKKTTKRKTTNKKASKK